MIRLLLAGAFVFYLLRMRDDFEDRLDELEAEAEERAHIAPPVDRDGREISQCN